MDLFYWLMYWCIDCIDVLIVLIDWLIDWFIYFWYAICSMSLDKHTIPLSLCDSFFRTMTMTMILMKNSREIQKPTKNMMNDPFVCVMWLWFVFIVCLFNIPQNIFLLKSNHIIFFGTAWMILCNKCKVCICVMAMDQISFCLFVCLLNFWLVFVVCLFWARFMPSQR